MTLKKISGGTIFNAGKSELDYDVFEKIVHREREKFNIKVEAAKAVKKVKNEKIEKYLLVKTKMMESNKTYKDLSVADLKVCIAPKRQKGDPSMPTKKVDILRLYEEYFIGHHRRMTPTPSPTNSDGENDVTMDDEVICGAENMLRVHYDSKGETYDPTKPVANSSQAVDEDNDDMSDSQNETYAL